VLLGELEQENARLHLEPHEEHAAHGHRREFGEGLALRRPLPAELDAIAGRGAHPREGAAHVAVYAATGTRRST
jgi:hypothetical protein